MQLNRKNKKGNIKIMACEWGRKDCCNQDKRCHLCIVKEQYYLPPKIKNHIPRAKATKRKGSQFEAKNSNINNDLLLGRSAPTPNSGAGAIKGDEQIKGLIRIMEELKEQNHLTSKGQKTFTIHKEWLDKLHQEALQSHQEFWYLKFIFSNADINEGDYYVILEKDILMSMVLTMWEDRKTAKTAQNRIDVAERRSELFQAENICLKAQIALLEAELKQLKEDKK